MTKHKLLIVTFLLFVFSFACRNQSKYNLVGVWNSKCFADKQGKTFEETLYFDSNKTLEKRIYIDYNGKDYSKHSGKYKVKNNLLELTYTKSDLTSEPIKNIRTIDWLSPNLIEVSGKNLKCYYTRVNFDS